MRYKPETKCHPFKKTITAKELNKQTLEKEKYIREQGYNLVVLWESEFDTLFPEYTPSSVTDIAQGSPLSYINCHTPTDMLDILRIQLVDNAFKGYKHKHTYRCLLCYDAFQTTLTQRKQAYRKYGSVGCPSCSSNKKIGSTPLLKTLQSFVGGNIVNNFLLINEGLLVFIQKTHKEYSKNLLITLQKTHKEKGERIIIIFEDEMRSNMKLVVNKIAHYCHQNTLTRIHGRQCSIREVSSPEKRDFLNTNHIQGNDNSQVAYGAFYDDQLVAIMTFTHPRVALGYKNKDRSVYRHTWELSRFTTDISIRIPGIASKLLKHFQRMHPDWQSIISYADARWSVGNLYDTLGFKLTRTNPPDYFYVINGKRKHRWNYRKDILKNTLANFDPTLTEYQNMVNHGFWRVWDCGTLRYEMNK